MVITTFKEFENAANNYTNPACRYNINASIKLWTPFVLLTFQGDKGNIGPPGQKGPKGAEGNRGNQGPQGAKGPPGKQVDRSYF